MKNVEIKMMFMMNMMIMMIKIMAMTKMTLNEITAIATTNYNNQAPSYNPLPHLTLLLCSATNATSSSRRVNVLMKCHVRRVKCDA